jgi:hypothetical protein
MKLLATTIDDESVQPARAPSSLLRAIQLLEREFRTQGFTSARKLCSAEDAHRPVQPGEHRTDAPEVRLEARVDVLGDAGIEHAAPALQHVEPPGPGACCPSCGLPWAHLCGGLFLQAGVLALRMEGDLVEALLPHLELHLAGREEHQHPGGVPRDEVRIGAIRRSSSAASPEIQRAA